MAFAIPRHAKPSGFVPINLAHPMARGIAAFMVPAGNGAFYDLVAQRPGTRNANVSLIATGEGETLHCNGSQGSVNLLGSIRNSLAVQNTAVSVIARLRLTALPGSNAIAVQFGGTAGTNARGACVGFNSSGQPLGGCITSGGLVSPVGSGSAQTGNWVTLAGCHTRTAAQGQLWVNGVSKGTAIQGGDTQVSNAATLYIGKEADNYNSSYTGDIAWIIAFNRIIGDIDASFFYRTPFAILEYEGCPRFSMPGVVDTLYAQCAF